MSLSEVESIIKSCVLSKKGDTTLNDLKGEYFQLVGQNIPFLSFGCTSLNALMSKLPGISISKNSNGETIVLVTTQKAAHIADLVSKQKPLKQNKIKKNPYLAKRQLKAGKKRLTPKKSPISLRNKSSGLGDLSNVKKFSKVNGVARNSGGWQQFPRWSQTQTRFIPAGEENSDDSYGCSPIRKENLSQRDCIVFSKDSDFVQRVVNLSDSNLSDCQHRSVRYFGNSLRCTVSTSPSTTVASFYPENVNQLSEERVKNPTTFSSWENGPVMLGYHLVGDDFLLNFAYECLHVDCEWDDSERLSCGMCVSGQTIHDFHNQIYYEGLLQPKMVLMLGAVDILQNNSLRCIIDDMTDLIGDITNSPVESVVLLTLPFLKNGGLANQKVLVFNEFLKTLTDDHRVYVLDAHSLFNKKYRSKKQNYDNCFNPKCFERVTRNILCYPNGVVLWSHIGRSHLYNFLLQQLNVLLKDIL